MNSLRRRLSRVLLVLAGGMLTQWFVADRMMVYVGEHEMQTRLQHDTDSLASALHVDADGALKVDSRAPGTIYERPYSGHYFVIAAGSQLFLSPSFGDGLPLKTAEHAPSIDHLIGPRGQPLLVLNSAVHIGGQRVFIVVGEDLTDMRHELFGFRVMFFALSLSMLIVAVMLQGRELRWALRPLDKVRDAVLAMAKGGAQVTAVDAPIEVRPLVEEIHRLLTLVQQRLQTSRTAIGNLSHALKTPLTVVFRLLEDPRMQALPDLRHQFQDQADVIHQRIERELKRARLAGSEPTRSLFDAETELPALVTLLKRIHGDKALTVDWAATKQVLSVDREDLLELIGNLADNACKWATSHVHIEIRAAGGLEIVVDDDGRGCSDEVLQRLGRRGEREDESVPGHGLGLSIVRDLVEAGGGSLEFTQSPLGGLRVTARLPRAARR